MFLKNQRFCLGTEKNPLICLQNMQTNIKWIHFMDINT